MTSTTEDQVVPLVALQPLTSVRHVTNDPAPLGSTEEESAVEEAELLTDSMHDCNESQNPGNALYPAQKPKRRKYVETTALYAGYFIGGLSYGIQGPSILDLQLAVRTDTKTITRLFIGRSVGHLSGVLLSGVILERFDCYVIYGLASFMMTTFLAVLPWTWHVVIMAISLALSAAGSGFCDAAANLCILMVWDAANGPWLQALHVFFALGALTGPLVVRPFLKEVLSEKKNENHTVSFVTTRSPVTVIVTDDRSAVDNCTSSLQYPDLGTDVWIPFLLLGVVGVIIACFFIGLYCTKSTEWSNTRKKVENVQEQHLPNNKVIKVILIFSVYVFYTCHFATLIGFQSYIFAFAVDYHGWHKSNAALLTSVNLISFMLGRVAGVLFIRYFRPSYLLILDCVGLVASNIPLAFFSHAHEAVIWVSTLLNGWFVSRLYATGITWLDGYIHISGMMTTVFIVAGSTGDMLGPVVLTALYGNYGLGAFAPLMLISSVSLAFMCLMMIYVARQMRIRDVTT